MLILFSHTVIHGLKYVNGGDKCGNPSSIQVHHTLVVSRILFATTEPQPHVFLYKKKIKGVRDF